MIRLDLTTHAVTAEGDGDPEHLITIRTLETEGSSSRVERHDARGPQVIGEIVRTRQGRNVMREYDLDEPGEYMLTSGRREMQQNRSFYIRLELISPEFMRIYVLPNSFTCPWVIEDNLHDHRNGETWFFDVRTTIAGVGTSEGEIHRIESDQDGVQFKRTTAWTRLLEDDSPDSV